MSGGEERSREGKNGGNGEKRRSGEKKTLIEVEERESGQDRRGEGERRKRRGEEKGSRNQSSVKVMFNGVMEKDHYRYLKKRC